MMENVPERKAEADQMVQDVLDEGRGQRGEELA
jgi:hypothetical protein